jgi:hypothetical protein
MDPARLLLGTKSLLALPVTVARAALDSPRAAAEHPASRELRRLLRAGYTVTRYRRGRTYDLVEITLVLDDHTTTVASCDLAFAAYASQAVPRAVARAERAAAGRVGPVVR